MGLKNTMLENKKILPKLISAWGGGKFILGFIWGSCLHSSRIKL